MLSIPRCVQSFKLTLVTEERRLFSFGEFMVGSLPPKLLHAVSASNQFYAPVYVVVNMKNIFHYYKNILKENVKIFSPWHLALAYILNIFLFRDLFSS